MIVTLLACKNFKSFVDESFTLTEHTRIEADNFQGKTSIGEGIVFGLYGTTLTGSPRTDHFTRNGAKKADVVVQFMVDGEEHEVRRIQAKTAELYLDGKKATQSDIDRVVGTKEKFLAAYWPSYFTSLSEKDGREMVMSLIQPPKQEDVVAKLDKAYQPLLNFDLISPDASAKDIRADIKANEQEVSRLEGKLEVLRERADMTVPEPMTFDDTELKSLRDKLQSLQSDVPSRIRQLETEQANMRRQYDLIKHQLRDVPDAPYSDGDKCPVCAQTMTGEALDHALQHHTAQIQEIAANNDRLSQECKDLIARGKAFKTELDKLKAEFDLNEVEQLKMKVGGLEGQQREVEIHNAGIERTKTEIESAKSEVEKLKANIKACQDAIFNGGETLKAIGAYRAKLAEMQVGQLKQHLNRVDIELFKVTKTTGEIKDCFTVTYEGREYKSLSYSEQIRAGLEISNLFNKAMGTTYPVFIDNAESITHYEMPATEQVIASYVQEGIALIVTTNDVEGNVA